IVGLFTSGMLSLSGETMAKLKKCRMAVVPGIGYDGIDLKRATQNGICVVNNPDYCLEEMADHTMLLLLALAKKLIITMDNVREGKWDAPGFHTIRNKVLPPVFRTSNQTLGLIGFGNIPRTLIPRAKPFFSKIIVYDPYVPQDVLSQFGVEPATLETVLRESDFVSLHAALTDENHNMMSLDQFKMMKPTAYFVNTARGGLVDEGALYTALTQGIIAGAGLDAMDPEPPKPDNPLLKLSNIIITSHTGQYSVEADIEIRTKPFEDIKRVMQGDWPREIAFRNPEVKDKFLAQWGK
ncbi:MAG: C-terminal binding protein, partial [Thermodesulfobacteriota bacterium]|nr:C-terminal binding protein [Thermodesulfobacteriota bacterium]